MWKLLLFFRNDFPQQPLPSSSDCLKFMSSWISHRNMTSNWPPCIPAWVSSVSSSKRRMMMGNMMPPDSSVIYPWGNYHIIIIPCLVFRQTHLCLYAFFLPFLLSFSPALSVQNQFRLEHPSFDLLCMRESDAMPYAVAPHAWDMSHRTFQLDTFVLDCF